MPWSTVSDPVWRPSGASAAPSAEQRRPPYTAATIAAADVTKLWWWGSNWTWNPATARKDMHGLPLLTPDDIPGGSDVDKSLFAMFVMFDRAGRKQMRFSPKKLIVCVNELPLLGEVVCREGRKRPVERLQGLIDLNTPHSKDLLRSGMATFQYVHRFCPGYASMAAPLLDLLKGNARFPGQQAISREWHLLKTAITRSITLSPIDKRYPIVVITDASVSGLGASIFTGPPDALQPYGFFSRRTNATERTRYHTNELEAAALEWIGEKLAPSGIWRGAKVLVRVDHANLSLYCIPAGGVPRSTRVYTLLTKFFYEHGVDTSLVYIKGEHNISDALSRLTTTDGVIDPRIADALRSGLDKDAVDAVRAASARYDAILSQPPAVHPSATPIPIVASTLSTSSDPNWQAAWAVWQTVTRTDDVPEAELLGCVDLDWSLTSAADRPAAVAAVAPAVASPDVTTVPSPVVPSGAGVPAVYPTLPLGREFCQLLLEGQTAAGVPSDSHHDVKQVDRCGHLLWAGRLRPTNRQPSNSSRARSAASPAD